LIKTKFGAKKSNPFQILTALSHPPTIFASSELTTNTRSRKLISQQGFDHCVVAVVVAVVEA